MTRRRAPRGGCWCNGRRYKGGQFLPATGRLERRGVDPAVGPALITREQLRALQDLEIGHVIATELPPSREYALAMRRVIRGTATGRDHRVVLGVRRQAIAMLADQGPDLLRPMWRGMLAAMPAR